MAKLVDNLKVMGLESPKISVFKITSKNSTKLEMLYIMKPKNEYFVWSEVYCNDLL